MDIQAYQKLHVRTPEAAEYLGISISNMEKMRLRGDGPCYAKLGRLVIYSLMDIEDWVKARKRLSTLDVSAADAKHRANSP